MIGSQIRARVRERAKNACEYCHLQQDDSPLAALHVEHIVPRIHGGSDDIENLALACIDCNLHKGTNLTGFDPETNELTELFHPRRQEWEDHFEWNGIYLAGKTSAACVPGLSAYRFVKVVDWLLPIRRRPPAGYPRRPKGSGNRRLDGIAQPGYFFRDDLRDLTMLLVHRGDARLLIHHYGRRTAAANISIGVELKTVGWVTIRPR